MLFVQKFKLLMRMIGSIIMVICPMYFKPFVLNQVVDMIKFGVVK